MFLSCGQKDFIVPGRTRKCPVFIRDSGINPGFPWGRRVLGEIWHSEVQVWVSELSARKSATVVIRAFGIVAGVIDVAVKDRRLPLNPARGVNLPRKRGKERHYLSHAQVQLLADESRGNGPLCSSSHTRDSDGAKLWGFESEASTWPGGECSCKRTP